MNYIFNMLFFLLRFGCGPDNGKAFLLGHCIIALGFGERPTAIGNYSLRVVL